jgi:hypothetical protein
MNEIKIGYKAMRSYVGDCYEPLTEDGRIANTYYTLNKETKQRKGSQGSFAVFDNLSNLYKFLRINKWLIDRNSNSCNPEEYKVIIAKVEFVEEINGSLWCKIIGDIIIFDKKLPLGTIFAEMVKPIEIISIIDKNGHELENKEGDL